jgi:hypothetical protein
MTNTSYTFTTAVGDVTAPVISTQNPTTNQAGVALTIAPTVTMNENCQTPSFPIDKIITVKPTGGSNMAGTETFDTTGKKTYTFTPTTALVNSTSYTVNMSGAKDTAGNFMVPVTWAFSTVDPPLTLKYSSAGTNALNFDDNVRIRRGIARDTSSSILDTLKIKKAIFSLAKSGSPTGTLTVCIRKGSDDTIAVTLGTLDVSTLTTTKTAYSFTNINNTYAMTVDDKVSIEYANGTSSNYVICYNSTSNTVDGANTCFFYYDSGTSTPYNIDATQDMEGSLWV